MRLGSRVATVLIGAALTSPAAGSALEDAARRLNGDWRSDTFVLRIDSARSQASVTPERPFEWQRFVVKEVAEDEIVFTVGAELFEAELEADTLVLTGTGFRGRRVLYRGAPADGLRGGAYSELP